MICRWELWYHTDPYSCQIHASTNRSDAVNLPPFMLIHKHIPCELIRLLGHRPLWNHNVCFCSGILKSTSVPNIGNHRMTIASQHCLHGRRQSAQSSGFYSKVRHSTHSQNQPSALPENHPASPEEGLRFVRFQHRQSLPILPFVASLICRSRMAPARGSAFMTAVRCALVNVAPIPIETAVIGGRANGIQNESRTRLPPL
jgi:hypothetical protein